ncbi:phenylacetic acid degradation operon negative regulatory protein PaaX [Rhodospirillaceae bacterium KN72]|uniref:Phenylacetic acid degradation operon negative regulatory protein PaaX n=1 Tax=Pacificispira spongiicola TaxID=2729598 RepID=A0A7Y0DZ89_9PROT|nr:PaaX family transcriptional regulator C-terminal domain-containing protein [Pacificispira spongiicola]NMM44320.1 phenylacetic acid degradation operon negative regulatory protein PaaX [Pacificispira spongiicola]
MTGETNEGYERRVTLSDPHDTAAPDCGSRSAEIDRPRAKSLIVTVYGDAILPHGGSCWLGELIELVRPLGLNERVTRTAVFRLVQDGILESERHGRRSRYTLTRVGRRQFDSAQAKIYASEAPFRDGRWTLILLPDGVSASERDALARDLGWEGYARLGPNLLGAARGDAIAPAKAVLSEHDLADACTIFSASTETDSALGGLAALAWPLDEIAADYNLFLDRFEDRGPPPRTDEDAFVRRVLLIHGYRRALLRDPALPDALLPPDWPGYRARNLARTLYRALLSASERHLTQVLGAESKPGDLAARFPETT